MGCRTATRTALQIEIVNYCQFFLVGGGFGSLHSVSHSLCLFRCVFEPLFSNHAFHNRQFRETFDSVPAYPLSSRLPFFMCAARTTFSLSLLSLLLRRANEYSIVSIFFRISMYHSAHFLQYCMSSNGSRLIHIKCIMWKLWCISPFTTFSLSSIHMYLGIFTTWYVFLQICHNSNVLPYWRAFE